MKNSLPSKNRTIESELSIQKINTSFYIDGFDMTTSYTNAFNIWRKNQPYSAPDVNLIYYSYLFCNHNIKDHQNSINSLVQEAMKCCRKDPTSKQSDLSSSDFKSIITLCQNVVNDIRCDTTIEFDFKKTLFRNNDCSKLSNNSYGFTVGNIFAEIIQYKPQLFQYFPYMLTVYLLNNSINETRSIKTHGIVDKNEHYTFFNEDNRTFQDIANASETAIRTSFRNRITFLRNERRSDLLNEYPVICQKYFKEPSKYKHFFTFWKCMYNRFRIFCICIKHFANTKWDINIPSDTTGLCCMLFMNQLHSRDTNKNKSQISLEKFLLYFSLFFSIPMVCTRNLYRNICLTKNTLAVSQEINFISPEKLFSYFLECKNPLADEKCAGGYIFYILAKFDDTTDIITSNFNFLSESPSTEQCNFFKSLYSIPIISLEQINLISLTGRHVFPEHLKYFVTEKDIFHNLNEFNKLLYFSIDFNGEKSSYVVDSLKFYFYRSNLTVFSPIETE